jgi:hypothetical protein
VNFTISLRAPLERPKQPPARGSEQQPSEHGVRGQVAAPGSPRFLNESVEPFESCAAHPMRCQRILPCHDVKGSANPATSTHVYPL